MPSSVSIPSCTSWSYKLPAALLIPALGWHLAVFDWLLAVWQGLVLCATAAQANLSCIVVNLHCSVRVFCSLFCPYICEGELLWGIWKGCNGTCLTLVKVLKDSPCFYILEHCLLYILSQHVFCWLKPSKFFVLFESQLGVNFQLECIVDCMVDAQCRFVLQLLKIKVDKCLCWGLASLWWMVKMVVTKNFWCRCLATYYLQRHVLVLCILKMYPCGCPCLAGGWSHNVCILVSKQTPTYYFHFWWFSTGIVKHCVKYWKFPVVMKIKCS